MHYYFGKDSENHICKDCSNFVKEQYHTRILQKCKVYGLTHSEATDWAQKYKACGMFNKVWNGNNIISLKRYVNGKRKDIQQLDGQITFEGE